MAPYPRPRCAACNGQLYYLGRVWPLDHYRCVDCGLAQAIDAPTIRETS